MQVLGQLPLPPPYIKNNNSFSVETKIYTEHRDKSGIWFWISGSYSSVNPSNLQGKRILTTSRCLKISPI